MVIDSKSGGVRWDHVPGEDVLGARGRRFR